MNLLVGIDLHSCLSDMAYPYTRSRARGEVADSDIEPSDSAPSAATSPHAPGIFEGPSVESVEGPESVSTESAGPVSTPAHSLPAVKPSHLGQSRHIRVCVSFSCGGLCPEVPQRQADPLDIGGQMSTGSATGIVVAEIHAKPEQSAHTTSRQPSATAAAVRLPPEGPSILHPM